MSRPIDGHDPDSLARGLDTGHTREVINALQRDAYQMCPEDFKRTVMQTARLDDKGFGDNLSVGRNGDILLNLGDTGQTMRIGNFRQQEVSWQQNHQRDDYNQDIGRRPNVYEGQQRGYYDDDRRAYNDRDRDYRDRDRDRDYSVRDRSYDNGRYPMDERIPVPYDRGGRYYDNNRGGFLNRHSGQYDAGQLLEDGLRGGISSSAGGGRFLPGAGANVGMGVILNLLGNGNRNRGYYDRY